MSPPNKKASEAGMNFAMDALARMPKGDVEELEAHITATLAVFWAVLWGTFGTEFARGFVEMQLKSMSSDAAHERFTPPVVH
jgi:hypothetical protein